MKVAIIAPVHIQPSEAWVEALRMEAEKSDAHVIIVDDSDGKVKLPPNWAIYDYLEQESFLGDLYPEFARMFHKCSACKAFGMLVAYEQGFDAVIVLDSDCIVSEGFVAKHLAQLGKTTSGMWQNPITDARIFSRGFPYSYRDWKIVANMGLWENVLDINGRDRTDDEPTHLATKGFNFSTPAPFPFSGMNLVISREAMLGFLFIPNANDFKRIDDIWGGYIFQKILQVNKQGASFGDPVVFHDTIVNAKEDEDEEIAMYECEDDFIEMVDEVFHDITYPKGDGFNQALFINMSSACRGDEDFDCFADAFGWWAKAITKYGK